MARQNTERPDIDRLFSSLAEQVKLPFVQVLHAVEMLGLENHENFETNRQTIKLASESAISMIDGYLLAVRLQHESRLELETVSVSSLLYDTAEALDAYAKLHNCELQLEIRGRYGPVMADYTALKLALINLGYSFINSLEDKQKVIKLAVRRNQNGITTGVFARTPALSSSLLKRAKTLQGIVHQPMAGFAGDNAAGVFVADSLFEGMDTQMRVAKLGGMNGLAATLMPSRQLSLV